MLLHLTEHNTKKKADGAIDFLKTITKAARSDDGLTLDKVAGAAENAYQC